MQLLDLLLICFMEQVSQLVYWYLKSVVKEMIFYLFIDASKLYEKGKNQNYLRDEHLQEILEAYKDRKEIDKFSHLASLKEIKENDFNLNIPRYVDTFEEEEPVDIKEVADEVRVLEEKESEVDRKIEEFCKELRIDTPF